MTIAIMPAAHTLAPAIEALRAQLDGELITAADAAYEGARRVIYFTVDRRPLVVVRPAGARDVAAAIRFARANDLPLAVRSGGHSVAHHSMIDGAVIVDLSGLKGVSVDPVARTARVQAGATSGDLAGPAGAHGLALSTGDTATVGMGGLTTGGGIGFMVRKFGLAIDNLLSAQVVTAAGEIVTASAASHPDLFWAIRGGGGNFGIVTEFTFRLAPVPQILGGLIVLPATREVLRGYLDYAAAAPDDLTTIANLMHLPPAPFVPQEAVGTPVVLILVTWSGSAEDGQRALAPLRALAAPLAEVIAPMPYPAMYHFTEQQGGSHGAVVRSMFADALSDETLDAALAALHGASSPFSAVQFRALGGAVARVGNEETAFAHRDKPYFLAIIGLWMDPAEDAAPHAAWVASLWGAVRRDSAGVYVNFLENEGEARIRDAYPAATYDRLAAIKAQYDPENTFRFNQNIPPRG